MTARATAIGLLAALGCATSQQAPVPAATPMNFKIVGYFPTWQGKVEDIRFDRLTHLNYAFVLPTPAGGLRCRQS
jgi:chitinase